MKAITPDKNGKIVKKAITAKQAYKLMTELGKIDGIYKIIINLDTGEQTRKHLAYEKTPKHLKGRVNYYAG